MKIKIKIKMKKIITILFALGAMLLVASCDFFEDNPIQNVSNESPENTETQNGASQSENEDSLLTAKIDSMMSSKLSMTNDEIKDVQKKVDNLETSESTLRYIIIIALIIAIIAFIVVIKKPSKKIIDKLFKGYNEKLSERINNIEQAYWAVGGNSRSVSQRSLYAQQQIEARLSQIESSINDLKNDKSTPDVNSCANNRGYDFAKEGYTSINSGRYFMDVSDYKKETSVFRIEFKNQFEGEFDIISLDKIKSRNDWQDVVEYTGNCIMADAGNCEVVSKGICKKISNDNAWEVTRKLNIKISK